ncbi:MAG: acyl-CoA thioesterase [Treponema sp.]|nr:acyl-CoA thioesterase [Treponema sp.]
MFTITITPRFGDADALGHINNVSLAIWFELARNSLFDIFVPHEKILSRENFPLILAHADYDYVAQMYLRTDTEIKTWIEKIGNKSFTIYHEAWQAGRLCAKGRVVIVYYDFGTEKSAPIPDDKRELLSRHLLPPG